MLELLLKSRKFMIGGGIVVAIVLLGIFGPMATKDPLEKDYAHMGEAPSREFLLGTTAFGEDVLAQLCIGVRNSLVIGALAGGIATLAAILFGGLGTYKGGVTDEISNACTNVVLVFPQLPLLILIAAMFEQRSLSLIAILIGILSWPWGARAIRSQVLSLKEREFINIARMSGITDSKIVIMEILPNVMAYIILVFVISLNIGILTEAGISVLGVGPEPGTYVTLGTMLYWAMNPSVATLPWDLWWCFLFPGVILTVFQAAVYLMHSGMDEVFNPRLRGE